MAEVIEQLVAAMNSHDPDAVAALFAEDYRSEQPLHPSRGFGGRDQVQANWTSVFDGVPDFFAESIASTDDGDRAWAELRWSGNHRDGSPFLMRGVILLGLRDDLIQWARLYLEPVELSQSEDRDIDAAVRDLYRPGHDSSPH
jgi:ketosteroid isomerase-like protein